MTSLFRDTWLSYEGFQSFLDRIIASFAVRLEFFIIIYFDNYFASFFLYLHYIRVSINMSVPPPVRQYLHELGSTFPGPFSSHLSADTEISDFQAEFGQMSIKTIINCSIDETIGIKIKRISIFIQTKFFQRNIYFAFLLMKHIFLDASLDLYQKSCRSVRSSIHPSI